MTGQKSVVGLCDHIDNGVAYSNNVQAGLRHIMSFSFRWMATGRFA
jgi:hypothetical protein